MRRVLILKQLCLPVQLKKHRERWAYLRPVMRFLLLVFLCLGFWMKSAAQAVPDTLINNPIPDSLRDRKRADAQQSGSLRISGDSTGHNLPRTFQPIPKKAALYSAMLPGAGQFYNRQYWKIPIIYAGMAASFYFLIDNLNQYRTFRSAYLSSLDPLGSDNPLTKVYNSQQLKILQDGYRQNLDLNVLFATLGFTLQVMDALVFAHLKNFDVSRDLSFKVRPALSPMGAGVAVVIGFR